MAYGRRGSDEEKGDVKIHACQPCYRQLLPREKQQCGQLGNRVDL